MTRTGFKSIIVSPSRFSCVFGDENTLGDRIDPSIIVGTISELKLGDWVAPTDINSRRYAAGPMNFCGEIIAIEDATITLRSANGEEWSQNLHDPLNYSPTSYVPPSIIHTPSENLGQFLMRVEEPQLIEPIAPTVNSQATPRKRRTAMQVLRAVYTAIFP